MITLDNTGVATPRAMPGRGTTNSNNYAIDTLRPTATIVVADTALKAGETSLVTFTFNEAVTRLHQRRPDDRQRHADGRSTTADGGITWTATFTPTADITDDHQPHHAGQYRRDDAAGNAGGHHQLQQLRDRHAAADGDHRGGRHRADRPARRRW